MVLLWFFLKIFYLSVTVCITFGNAISSTYLDCSLQTSGAKKKLLRKFTTAIGSFASQLAEEIEGWDFFLEVDGPLKSAK